MIRTLALLVSTVLLGSAAWSQSASKPDAIIAYSVGGILTIKSASGHTLHVFKPNPPVGTFAISPDAQTVVFAPLGPAPMHNGGQLYLLSVASGRIRRLTHAQIYDKQEVYSDPTFSPDGNQVLFAIHIQMGTDGDDLVMDAGPFAVLNLRSGAISKLPATLDVEGYGTVYGDSSRWSPNGKKLFLNAEDHIFLTTPSGNHLQDTSPWTGEGADALDWLGDECVVYLGGNQPNIARVLNVRTHKTEALDKLLHVSPELTTNLVAFSHSLQVRKSGERLIVHGGNSSWSILDQDKYPLVRVLEPSTAARVPPNCQ